jgi:transketolase
MGAPIEITKEYKIGDMVATREAYGQALVDLGAINQDVVVLDADLSGSTMTKHFAKAYPERFFNMGIAENNMMGVSAGLARMGKIPYASSFAMFAAGRAWEFVRNSIAHNHLAVRVCATHAGLTVGEDGASHQVIEDVALMRAIPTMTVIVPADATEAYQAILTIAELNSPSYVRLGRAKVPVVFDSNYKFTIGKISTIQSGTDISLIACGVAVWKAMEAAKLLTAKGHSVEIINCASIKPIDVEGISNTAMKTGRVITIEEHNIIGGLGEAVAAVLAENCNKVIKFKRMGIEDQFGQSGDGLKLLDHYGLSAENIAREAEKLLCSQ